MKKIFLYVLLIVLGLSRFGFGDEAVPVWTNIYNGIANGLDAGNASAVDTAGNVYVTGYESVAGQSFNTWIRKYDKNGNVVWTRTFNGAQNGVDFGNGITVDASGNVYVAGQEEGAGYQSDIWIRKYDADGNVLWTKNYAGTMPVTR